MDPKKEMLKKQIFDAQSRVDLIKLGKEHIIVDKPGQYITRITINREKHFRNALSNETRAALFDQLQYNDQDPDCRVTIIRGNNGIFCSGYDLPDRKTALPSFTSESDGQQQRNNVEGWFMINDLAKPVVASVEGECLGGGMELAAACDVVLVATDSVIGYPAIRGQGLPDFQVYPWLMGHRNAMEIMLTNRQMSGEEAVERGFATACYPPNELEAKSLEFTARIAKIPADLLAFNKRSVHRAFEAMGFRTNIRNGLDLEALMFKAPGAKMLVARRVTKPGEARSPPPRPNSSQPTGITKDAPLSAPPSLVALSGPVVGVSAVSATPSSAPTTQKITPPVSVPKPAVSASSTTPATASSKPPASKVAAPPKVATKSPAAATKVSATPSTTPSKPAAQQATKPSQPIAKAAAVKPTAVAKPPTVAPQKSTAAAPSKKESDPIETKSEPQEVKPSTGIKVGPKRVIQSTAGSVAPKKVSAESAPTPAPSPSKPILDTKAALSNKKEEAKPIVKTAEADEYSDESGVHIHLHDEINIHIYNDKSKL